MQASDAQKRASAKWEKEKVEKIIVRLPRGIRKRLNQQAKRSGESVNQMINRLITAELDNHCKQRGK